MKLSNLLFVSVAALFNLAPALLAQNPVTPQIPPSGQSMFVIEREIPGAGNMTPAELKSASQKSCAVLRKQGPKITWVQSYVTNDRLYCVYLAPNEAMIHEHARESGFPANAVSRVATIISPETAD